MLTGVNQARWDVHKKKMQMDFHENWRQVTLWFKEQSDPVISQSMYTDREISLYLNLDWVITNATIAVLCVLSLCSFSQWEAY